MEKRWFVWLSFLLLGVGLILVGCTGVNQGDVASQKQLRALEDDLAALRQNSAEMEELLAAHDGRLLTLEESRPAQDSGIVSEDSSGIQDVGLGEIEAQVNNLTSQLAELRSEFDELASTFAEMRQRTPDRQPPSSWGSGNGP